MMCEVVRTISASAICARRIFGMHFLKTGFNGVRYFQNAVLVDILVRPIRIGITVLIASMPFINLGVNIWSVFDIIMISSIVSVGLIKYIQIHGSGNVYLSAGAYSYLPGNCR